MIAFNKRKKITKDNFQSLALDFEKRKLACRARVISVFVTVCAGTLKPGL